MPTYNHFHHVGPLLYILMFCCLEVAVAGISLALADVHDDNARFDHAVLTHASTTSRRKTSNLVEETDTTTTTRSRQTGSLLKTDESDGIKGQVSLLVVDGHHGPATRQDSLNSMDTSRIADDAKNNAQTQTFPAMEILTAAKDDDRHQVQETPATHHPDLPIFKHRLYPEKLNTWMGDGEDFYAGYGCDTLFSKEIPDDEALWPLLQGIYRGVVGPKVSSFGEFAFGDGFAVDVRVKYAGKGRGRGIFAAEHLPKGTTIWSTKMTAHFHEAWQFRNFLLALPSKSLVCDVLQWAYLFRQEMHPFDDATRCPYFAAPFLEDIYLYYYADFGEDPNEPKVIALDLDRSSLFNGSQEKDEEYLNTRAQLDFPDDYSIHAGLEIGVDEEITVDYSFMEDIFLYRGFGLEGNFDDDDDGDDDDDDDDYW